MENYNETVIETILSPILSLLEEEETKLGDDKKSYKLSFLPFTMNIIFAFITKIKSVRLLVTEIKSSSNAKELNLLDAPKTLYSEAFSRYDPAIYKNIFTQLVKVLPLIPIPGLEDLGRLVLVDGSIFPTALSVQWATYKKKSYGIKLHLAFDLNKMIPLHFLSEEANGSERCFLKSILEKGATYICDRGYASFDVFNQVGVAKAYFIIRSKSSLLHTVTQTLDVDIPLQYLAFIDTVKDRIIVFDNDKTQNMYRAIQFSINGDIYFIITNRFDLSTYQIIMLYAYRWQIELFFRFLKRTLNGIHLMTHDEEGISIQFYLYMIVYLLLLNLKQKALDIESNLKEETQREEMPNKDDFLCPTKASSSYEGKRAYVCGLVTYLGDKLKKFWKLSLHWCLKVKNFLLRKFEDVKLQLQ